MRTIYALGETGLFRLTKASAHPLLLAICKHGGEIVSAGIDRTCPPTYASLRISLPRGKKAAFEAEAKVKLETIPTASGQ